MIHSDVDEPMEKSNTWWCKECYKIGWPNQTSQFESVFGQNQLNWMASILSEPLTHYERRIIVGSHKVITPIKVIVSPLHLHNQWYSISLNLVSLFYFSFLLVANNQLLVLSKIKFPALFLHSIKEEKYLNCFTNCKNTIHDNIIICSI